MSASLLRRWSGTHRWDTGGARSALPRAGSPHGCTVNVPASELAGRVCLEDILLTNSRMFFYCLFSFLLFFSSCLSPTFLKFLFILFCASERQWRDCYPGREEGWLGTRCRWAGSLPAAGRFQSAGPCREVVPGAAARGRHVRARAARGEGGGVRVLLLQLYPQSRAEGRGSAACCSRACSVTFSSSRTNVRWKMHSMSNVCVRASQVRRISPEL